MNDTFSLVEDEGASEPSFFQDIPRQAGRTALRFMEGAAGAPGDILSLINDYIAGPISSKITGNEALPYEKLGVSSILPTSQQLAKKSGVKPKDGSEQFFDDIARDAGSLFAPGTAVKKGVGLLGKGAHSLFSSVFANTAKKGVEDLTANENKGNAAYLGALTMLSFLDKKGAAKAIAEGYRPLDAKVKTLSPVPASKLKSSLEGLRTSMQKGTVAPSEKFIIDEVNAILPKIENGLISPEELWASKRSLNEKLTNVLYDIKKKPDQQRARKLSSIISQELDNGLKLTAKQDPKFYKELKGWNNAYKVVADSNVITRWVENNVKYSPATPYLLHTLGVTAGVAGAPAALTYQLGKIGYRMAKSPKLAKHYAQTIAAASAENSILFNKHLKALDKEIQREEAQDTFSIIED